MLGMLLGNYRIVEQLAEGGMGVVYIGRHESLGRRVVVKVLLPELSRDADMVQRFFNEAQAATAIRHPGIVHVIDFGTAPDGRAYFAMELLEGQSLTARLQQRRLDFIECCRIGRQVANVLHAAHTAGITHRDLKPDNVFMISDPEVIGGERVKVLDFGVAKLAGDAHAAGIRTRTGLVMGSPTYMSPEQCRSFRNADARSDIYSLGCILFEMACGRPPFLGEGLGDIVGAHIHTPPPHPQSLAPDMPPELSELLSWMLSKPPDARPQAMAEISQSLDEVLHALGAPPPRPPTPLPMRPARPSTARPPTPLPAPPTLALSSADLTPSLSSPDLGPSPSSPDVTLFDPTLLSDRPPPLPSSPSHPLPHVPEPTLSDPTLSDPTLLSERPPPPPIPSRPPPSERPPPPSIPSRPPPSSAPEPTISDPTLLPEHFPMPPASSAPAPPPAYAPAPPPAPSPMSAPPYALAPPPAYSPIPPSAYAPAPSPMAASPYAAAQSAPPSPMPQFERAPTPLPIPQISPTAPTLLPGNTTSPSPAARRRLTLVLGGLVIAGTITAIIIVLATSGADSSKRSIFHRQIESTPSQPADAAIDDATASSHSSPTP